MGLAALPEGGEEGRATSDAHVTLHAGGAAGGNPRCPHDADWQIAQMRCEPRCRQVAIYAVAEAVDITATARMTSVFMGGTGLPAGCALLKS